MCCPCMAVFARMIIVPLTLDVSVGGAILMSVGFLGGAMYSVACAEVMYGCVGDSVPASCYALSNISVCSVIWYSNRSSVNAVADPDG